MKKSHLVAALAAVVLSTSLAATQAAGQAPARTASTPSRGGPYVALLDVSRVFKNNSRFKAMMDQMKGDVTQAEAWVKREREELQKLAERLKDYRKGSPEYKATEEQLTKRSMDVSIQVKLQQKKFLESEATIYHTVYQEIIQELDHYCNSNGIAMVLRFSGDSIDPGVPEDVLRGINKPVVWHNRGLDITDQLLQILNQRAGTAQRPAPGATPHSATRSGITPYRGGTR